MYPDHPPEPGATLNRIFALYSAGSIGRFPAEVRPAAYSQQRDCSDLRKVAPLRGLQGFGLTDSRGYRLA